MKSNKLTEDDQQYIKLDYSLENPEDRVALVNQIIASMPEGKLTKRYLEILSDYILMPNTIQQRKEEKPIITKNRQTTLNLREVSLEGFATKFTNTNSDNKLQEEDLIYNLALDNDKTVLLTPRYKITQEDLDRIPELKQCHDAIEQLKKDLVQAKGKARLVIKKNIIDLCKDQYVIRAAYTKSVNCMNPTKSVAKLDLYENVKIDENDQIIVDSNISLLIPEHIKYILTNYSKLKQESYGKFESDMYYLLLSLEDLIDRALADFPLYYDLLVYKIDGLKNDEIQRELQATFGIQYSLEYISSLWRNKIPKLIADQAQKDWLEWHYTEEEVGYWKRCSRCGQIKLGHSKFFSKNKTSKDGWYSICKECRNNKVGKVKD